MPSAANALAKVVAEPTRRNRSKTERTTAASASFTTSFRSLTSYPSGGYPPIHMPRARDARNLSRMRSPITSRSNWAKESRMLSVSRPMLVVVLNDCVTLTKVTLLRSNTSTSFGEIHQRAATLREALLVEVEKHPNLKAHPGPQTIYLQWRIA